MNELCDGGRTRGIDGPVERARLEAEARTILESGIKLADRIEAALDMNLSVLCFLNLANKTREELFFIFIHAKTP